MKFDYKFIISGQNRKEGNRIIKAFWSPTVKDWKDVIEDYIIISRKRINNKFALFKLQLHIFEDIISLYKYIDGIKVANADELHEDFVQTKIKSHEIIIQALREVVDGIVWRLFDFDRSIIHILAENTKGDSVLRPTDGALNELYKFNDVFLDKNKIAILNSITNCLRIGDITTLDKKGNFEFIEVKSSKRAARSLSDLGVRSEASDKSRVFSRSFAA